MRQFLLFFLLTGSFFTVFGQNSGLEGTVTDAKTGARAAGVSVTVVGLQKATSTNVNGLFSLKLEPGKYTLLFSSVGYSSKEISEVTVEPGKIASLDVNLELAPKTEEAVVIRATARLESTNALLTFQKNTNTVAQVVSSEAIRRSPDRSAGDVLKRIPGASVQEGKYLVVRGLSDRYNQAMLNGVQLSSTEPDRKTFSFDIFPSAMIDNMIVNKAFVPELPGEWAGGLVQVNTKDVPTKSFLNIQVGTGFNTQTIGNDFYTYKGGKTDWLGYDDGTRALPANMPSKNDFRFLNAATKTQYGLQMQNVWSNEPENGPLMNASFQLSGGVRKQLGKNKLGGIFALTYSRNVRRTEFHNSFYTINGEEANVNFDYYNNKYARDILAGALGNVTLELGNNHKISFRNILNINTTNYVIRRTGKDFENDSENGENIRASELSFKANTFFNTQLSGDHNLRNSNTKFHWFGSFNILDQYIPDQRRIQYNQNISTDPNAPYLLLISNTRSQKTGSRYYGFLNDYVYNAGADLSKKFNLGERSQTIKGGYLLQVKDRLFDSRPINIYLPTDNETLRMLPEDQVFNPQNFGDGFNNLFAYDENPGSQFRYVANTILNAAFIQFDNQVGERLRAVWGLRWEKFDQVVGSMKKSDPRHVHSVVDDFLPGINLTYKVNNRTNIRLSGSQTVIRPEFRELSPFAFFDFELGATLLGNKNLVRTKVSNVDLRYELYPRAGELLTVGAFYKYFKNPIELYFNQSGAGTSNTFNYLNAEKATGFGMELEFRKKLDMVRMLKNFTVHTNLSYIFNEVKDEATALDRPMQGQSPYLINAAIQYDLPDLGLSTTMLFNRIGRRILYVGNEQIPAIWEAPRSLIDLQVSKKVIKERGELKLNISDLLNSRAYFYHDLDQNKQLKKSSADAIAIDRRYGTNVNLTFSYKIK